MTPPALEQAVLDHLYYTCAQDQGSASTRDLYVAMAHAMRDRLLHRWLATRATYRRCRSKRVYYLSAEFLLGRVMAQNLLSLGLRETAEEMLAARGLQLDRVLEEEREPGLGNGGLGRLAACFLDSTAALALPCMGYGIRYDYGIFEQRIVNGEQVERGDTWLRRGNPWEIPRYELAVEVHLGGRVEAYEDDVGVMRRRWVDGTTVLGVPYDLPIAGYGNDTVNTLRLWAARASNEFDLHVFNSGDFRRAVAEKATTEAISRVLYPADHSPEGKELRLKQQYFFCRCAIQDILRRYAATHDTLDELSQHVAIQLNDTHPSIAIAELMRVLVDDHHFPWEQAWELTRETFAYTNHTLMPEALEKWPVSMFERLLPRHLEIIYEVNARLLEAVKRQAPGDAERLVRTSIIEEEPERAVRMAHLAACGSHSINGVAELHSELVRTRLLADFAHMWPQRFNNKTNGVSPRRWLMLSNPQLSALFDRELGTAWRDDLQLLSALSERARDPGLQREMQQIKALHKANLAHRVQKVCDVSIDPESLFVVQIKRIHEYKRQLLNALYLISAYQRLREGKDAGLPSRTFLVAGKAAPGYRVAKLHIRLLCDIASVINADPALRNKLRLAFVPNYSVTVAERIIPAADISLQISLAGTEASGTGNMKLGMNGALTLGTLDGANIEIREAVGSENFFLFGMDAARVESLRHEGYRPAPYITQNPRLAGALELLVSGHFSPNDPHRYREVVDNLRHLDAYMCCADFGAYAEALDGASQLYADPSSWWRMVLHNATRLGRFSSDETIRRYARDIWNTQPVRVQVPE